MREAVDEINRHIARGSKICVWGDYDVDGVSAVTILLETLKNLGANVTSHIPSRHDEGYGLNREGVMNLGCDLIITVDCGVSEWEIIKEAVSGGMSVIVTDHHAIPDTLPGCIVVNPLLGGYPNPYLCGAGVAFKLALALCPDAKSLIDIAALATIADLVPLLGENRAIASLGLKAMNAKKRPGIKALLDAAGVSGEIDSQTVAFQISPRLNATGRLADAEKARRLLETSDPDEAAELARELNNLNSKRRDMEKRVVDDCEKKLESYNFKMNRAIVLGQEGWNPGVVGLAASRLCQKYNLPTVLLSSDGKFMTGSCRSIPKVNIHSCLTAVKGFLTRFGGHSQAAGLTLPVENFDEFSRRLNSFIAENTPEDAFIPIAEYDCNVSIGDVSSEFIKQLSLLEPTGFGNPPPSLLASFEVADARRIGRDGSHASFTAKDSDAYIRAVWFGSGSEILRYSGSRVSAVFSASINEFRGVKNAQLQIQTLEENPHSALKLDADDEERLINAFITHRLYNNDTADKREAISERDLIARVCDNPKGTLVIAADAKRAARFIDAIIEYGSDKNRGGRAESSVPDVCAGYFPQDPRLFNALCLLPEGDVPEGYDLIACLDFPASLVSPKAVDVSKGGRAEWIDGLPGIDKLRSVYISCRTMADRPMASASDMALCREVSRMAGVNAVAAHAGLLALDDMELIVYQKEPARIDMRTFKKVDPKSGRVFGVIARLKEWGGA